jgi:glyoxylase-like metal-dependent hydrolase (beta-lactamase superfamily II)
MSFPRLALASPKFRETKMTKTMILALAALALPLQPVLAQQETSRWMALAERDWADLPVAAQDAPIPQDVGFLSREVKPGVFVVTEGLYQAMFVVTNKGVVVVDSPPTIGPKLSAAIKAATDKPVTHFIYSHSHIDHVGAAAQFGNVMRLASRETAAKLARLADPNRPKATRVLQQTSNRLMIDGVEFQFDTRTTHHEPGNLYIHLPKQRVLMIVDIVFPGWVPFTNLGMAEDVQGFIDAHDAVLAYDFDVLVGGHLSRPGTRTDVETQKAYVRDLIAAAQEGQRAVNFGAVAGEVGFANRWLLVKTYMDRVADHCAGIMLEKWKGKLGGAAVSTPGHCWIMQEHLNINGIPAT